MKQLSQRSGLLLVLTLGVVLLFSVARQAHADGATVVALTPTVMQAAPATTARGPFLERSLAVALPAGPLRLAATADGRGEICVDDELRLVLADAGGVVATWEHVFATPDRRAIACLPPPLIADLLQAGTYTVTVTLSDRRAPTYSATPLLLVAGTPAAPAPAAAAAPLGSARPTAAPAIAAPPTVAVPSAPTAAPRATLAPPPVTPAATAAMPDSAATLAVLWPWALVGGFLLLALVLVPRRPRPHPVATGRAGTVQLVDRATGETRTVVLVGQREQLVRRRPLRLAADGSGPGVASLRLYAEGLLLRLPDGAVQTVGHNAEVALDGGQLVLRFRTLGAAAPQARTTPKGAAR